MTRLPLKFRALPSLLFGLETQSQSLGVHLQKTVCLHAFIHSVSTARADRHRQLSQV